MLCHLIYNVNSGKIESAASEPLIIYDTIYNFVLGLEIRRIALPTYLVYPHLYPNSSLPSSSPPYPPLIPHPPNSHHVPTMQPTPSTTPIKELNYRRV